MVDPEQPATQDELRVSDNERNQVVELLGQAAADGRLTLDEYSARAAQTYASRTRGELVPLTRDLVEKPEAANLIPAPSSARTEPVRVSAIFGLAERTGRWPVPRRLLAKALFGECRIEMQHATLHHELTVIDAVAIFGETNIYVPRGVRVRLSGSVAFGSTTSELEDEAMPGAPEIEVRCRVRFGSVNVRLPH